jgi:uncharacterized protein YggE
MSDTNDHDRDVSGGASVDAGPTAQRRRRWALAGAAAFGVGALVIAGCNSSTTSTADAPSCVPGSARLTVQGTGLATGTPDTLTVDVEISVTEATAQQALADDNVKAAAVVAAFTAGGVTKPDIQTTGLSVQPNYTFADGSEQLTGYGVDNTVTAMITNLTTAGDVLDAVSAAAGDAGQIGSATYSIRDPRNLEVQARTDAVHQAVSHAQTMAAAADERLGPVCSLTDTTPTTQFTPEFNAAAGTVEKAALPAPVPLEAGSQQANAQVTIVYSLSARSTTA